MVAWFLACGLVMIGCWAMWGWAGVAIALGACVMATILLVVVLRE